MGVYDHIRCRAPLPGTPPPFVDADHEFQTKDFEDPFLEHYEITRDGRLLGPDGETLDHDGDLAFYTSNAVSWRAGQRFTERGEDAEWVKYVARFERGRLVAITEVERTREPARPASEL